METRHGLEDRQLQAYRMRVSVSETLPFVRGSGKKEFIRAFIYEMQIFEERKPDGRWVKSFHFRFPVMMEPGTGTEWWRLEAHDDTVVLMSGVKERWNARF